MNYSEHESACAFAMAASFAASVCSVAYRFSAVSSRAASSFTRFFSASILAEMARESFSAQVIVLVRPWKTV